MLTFELLSSVYVFDILYVKYFGESEGHSLLERPLYQRKGILEAVLTPKPTVLEFGEYWICTTTEEIKELLQRVVMGR